MRHHILYADVTWKKQRLMPFILLAGGIVMGVYEFVGPDHGHLRPDSLVWLLYVPAGLAILGVLQLNRLRSYVQAGEDGITVHRLIKSTVIGYDNVRSVRVQPLGSAYQNGRRRMVNQLTRPLLESPALFVKLRGNDEELAGISRRLGAKLAFDGMAVLPVADPGAAVAEIEPRLPLAGSGANLGGGRRRKRRR